MSDQERIYAEQIIALLRGIKAECAAMGNILAVLVGAALSGVVILALSAWGGQ